jgi:hypothetical protein
MAWIGLDVGIEHVTKSTKRAASINLSPDENNRSAVTYPSPISSDRRPASPRNVRSLRASIRRP